MVSTMRGKCSGKAPEHFWQFIRDNWLTNRIFRSCDDIVAHCCEVWNKLIDQSWHIMSSGGWADGC